MKDKNVEISDELYREVILDHYKSPRQYGAMEKPDILESGINPLCGDELHLFLAFKGDTISDIRFQGKGCSISRASASMMTEALLNRNLPEVQKIVAEFKSMMLDGRPADSLPEVLEDAKSLEGVRRYPVRIKCAVLAWNTLLEALKKYKKG